MRTTLVLTDPVFKRAKYAAKEDSKQLSMLVNEAVEAYLVEREQRKKSPAPKLDLPTFAMGEAKTDINNRDALYRAMEE
ncbi:hypothetical protein [Kiritimatiella glycovorans]|uniref:Uncharacterized protein n=1 Tax=Kiritimatiella glycovorans TaxID=1307763 RepID=A0A0G3ED00_9BACT|nr:hypothetical protein [Kiritimatiella glycovorans]AKJ64188.1 hypothetical protein L21SP4_00926 [Kiritimatiella glycovorans]